MLTTNAPLQLSHATARMMRACALAAARSWSVPVLGGLSLWSQVLRVPTPPPSAGPAVGQPPAPAAFASYRSGGGHAVAQVIVAGEDRK
jgi:hypothetical protein